MDNGLLQINEIAFPRPSRRYVTIRRAEQLCELFGVEKFVGADMQAFNKVIELWEANQ